ncbi:MAG: hypothetical protein EPN56_06515 [Rhodanobacter sp.]|nr:MAG: hypothetical protein EPN78_14080 [Rhodanobacter sp.]TAM13969.1 MAG: hypothetical protein EPN66_03125 [Rhodanobacter sp.]TAM36606.1 MAG: hypothetical protein EPN56_06515 [Rhodanobacter sp.]
MRTRYRWIIVSLMALATSSAWAASSGRISFSGAVLVPTCVAQAETAALAMGNPRTGHLYACGGQSRGYGVVDTPVYVFSMQRMDNVAAAGSPLLQYFVGYRVAAHATTTQMVTRTYE